MEQLDSHWTDFHEIWYLKIFRKIQVSLKSDKNKGYFPWWPIHIFIIFRSFLFRMSNVSDKGCRENQSTHFIFNNFFSKIVMFMICGKILQNGVGQRWQYGAGAMHSVYLRLQIHTHTHTHRLCNTKCFSTAILVARARLKVTLHAHCLFGFLYVWSLIS